METVLPKQVRILGHCKEGKQFTGSDITVIDVDTGLEFAECQAIGLGISIDDRVLEAILTYIDFNKTAPDGTVWEGTCVVNVVDINICGYKLPDSELGEYGKPCLYIRKGQ